MIGRATQLSDGAWMNPYSGPVTAITDKTAPIGSKHASAGWSEVGSSRRPATRATVTSHGGHAQKNESHQKCSSMAPDHVMEKATDAPATRTEIAMVLGVALQEGTRWPRRTGSRA